MLRHLAHRLVRPAAAGVSGGWRGISSSGPALAPLHIEDETHCRQRSILVLDDKLPTIAPDAWVAPNAVVVGDVDLNDGVSVWYGSVIRGDLSGVNIGRHTSIGERTTVSAASASPTGGESSTNIGSYVTIGAGCALRSCQIGSETVIEDKCVLMEGSSVGAKSILGAGSVLTPGRSVPDGQMWAGNPAKYVRDVSAEEVEELLSKNGGKKYAASQHSFEWLPFGNVYASLGK